MTTVLTATFADVLRAQDITVNRTGTQAVLNNHTINADSPAELRAQLAAMIYSSYHIRHPQDPTAPQSQVLQADAELAEKLLAALPQRTLTRTVTAEQLQPGAHPDQYVLPVDGIKVIITEDVLIRTADGAIAGVRFPSWRTRTTPGYLLTFSQQPICTGPVERIYIACDDAAQTLARWGRLLPKLAEANIGYQAKALSTRAAHPRTDAIVIYVGQADLHLACELAVQATLADAPAHVMTSLFTRQINPDVSMAAEPSDTRTAYRNLSFGQHRARVLADALIRTGTENRQLVDTWTAEATAALIDPHQPGRNYTA